MKRSIILRILNYSITGAFLHRLAESKRKARREKVADYKLNSTGSPVALSSLFGAHNDLIVVHNMGQSWEFTRI